MKLASSTCSLPQVSVPSPLPAGQADLRAFYQPRPLSPASSLLRIWPSTRTRCSWQRRPFSLRRNSCWKSPVSWAALVGKGMFWGLRGRVGAAHVSGLFRAHRPLPSTWGGAGCTLMKRLAPSWAPRMAKPAGPQASIQAHAHTQGHMAHSGPPKAPKGSTHPTLHEQ